MNKDLQKRSVLITGATGFIGSNLTRHLVKLGAKPHVILRGVSDTWRIKDILSNIDPHHCDVTDKNGIEALIKEIKPKVIFHTAIYGGFPSQKDDKKISDVNFNGTVNLVNACAKIDYELFVNTGSSSEYGIKDQPMKETDATEPLNDYGRSKAAATEYCRAAAEKDKKPIVTLRLFSPYGYFEDRGRLIPSVILSCLNGTTPKCSSPSSVRDFVFIEDVIDAYIKALELSDKISGEVINVGGGHQHAVGDVVDKIMEIIGYKNGAEWNTITNPRTEPKMWQADISKARHLIGWQPKNRMDEGLEKTVRWFKENAGSYEAKT
jgi:nucleoside-diphosphate-sugar epimerase